MSKKKKGQFQQNPQAPQSAPSPGLQPAPQEPPAMPEAQAPAPPTAVPRAYFLSFWGLIIAAVTLAWTLSASMPNVHEYVIERWIMVGLSVALGILLIIFK